MTANNDNIALLSEFLSRLAGRIGFAATINGDAVMPADLVGPKFLFPVFAWQAAQIRAFSMRAPLSFKFSADESAFLGYRIESGVTGEPLSECLVFLAEALMDVHENSPRNRDGYVQLDGLASSFIGAMNTVLPPVPALTS